MARHQAVALQVPERIVGAGRIGSVLARRLKAVGHQVQIANSRGPQTLGEVAPATGATPGDLMHVADAVDLLIIAIPFGQVRALPVSVIEDLASGP